MIEIDECERAVWLTINNPETKNALSGAGWDQLHDGIEQAEESMLPVILTGTGDTFSAGDDMGDYDEFESTSDVETYARKALDTFEKIEHADVPVISAVNGGAYGGGVELAIVSDLAVAVEDAVFVLPETSLGIHPPVATERIAVAGGRKRMMEMILTNEPVDAETAAEWGLINKAVPADQLEAAVVDYVDAIAEADRNAIKWAKQYANNRISQIGEKERWVTAGVREFGWMDGN